MTAFNEQYFALTQEFVPQLFGVRRASGGEIAGHLREARLIQYNRDD